ncbi:hypothetical protein EAO71_27270 [Streptomyces sp. ms191]|uniref:hypothetical protein n=1 Tax=Streptomyces sp. ms191 TaxID=1827978 RepID=UPI0011CDA4E2|nr:hypothetical protein [Streptomyces sp. ms191]TXS21403.1 hypothetical protein EAO71_27270 [Streptomyces sp. ms191]
MTDQPRLGPIDHARTAQQARRTGPETVTITTEALARLHSRVDKAESRLAAQEHELGNLRIDKAGHDAVSQAWARKLREAEAAIERVTSPTAIRAAAFAISDYAFTHLGRDLGTIHIEPMAEAGIRAALDPQEPQSGTDD